MGGLPHDFNVQVWALPGCPPVFGTYKKYSAAAKKERETECKVLTEKWEQATLSQKPRAVVLASRWAWLFESENYAGKHIRRDYLVDKESPNIVSVEHSKSVFERKLRETVDTLVGSGIKVVLFSQVPLLANDPDSCEAGPLFRLFSEKSAGRCQSATYDEVRGRLAFTDRVIVDIARDYPEDVMPVIMSDIFCDSNGRKCIDHFTGIPLYRNDNHLNAYGSMYVARYIERELAEFIGENSVD